jgi:hypothetical protein
MTRVENGVLAAAAKNPAIPTITYAALDRPQTKQVGQQGAETRPDLGDRPFTAPGSTGADRQGAGHNLHQRDARPDFSLAKMIGGDRCIGAVALGFRGKGVDDQPAQQPAHGRDDEQQPGMQRRIDRGKPRGERFAAGPHRMVTRQRSQGVILGNLRGNIEDDRPEPGDDTHQRGEAQEPELAPKTSPSELQELRHPME